MASEREPETEETASDGGTGQVKLRPSGPRKRGLPLNGAKSRVIGISKGPGAGKRRPNEAWAKETASERSPGQGSASKRGP